jgi:two-component system, OmpR family, phosphate regulon sensor histidine kinase PhoR
MKIKISSKLILNYLVLMVVIFSLATFYILHKLSLESRVRLEDTLITQARLISQFISPDIIEQADLSRIQPLVLEAKRNTAARITIIAKDGKVLGDSEADPAAMENHKSRPEVDDALNGIISYSSRFSFTLHKNMLYTAIPALNRHNNVTGVIRVSLPLATVKELTINVLGNLWAGILIVLILTILLGYISAHFISRPIVSINQIAAKAAQGDLEQEITISTNDEIGDLARTLNLMFSQLKDKIEEMNKEKNKISAILGSMSEGVIACDNNSRILLMNQTIEQMFSVKPDDYQGKMFLEVIRNNDLHDILTRVISGGRLIRKEISILLPVEKTFLIHANPLLYSQKVVGAVMVLHDITEIKRLENMRKEFVSNVSHELRTPLTSIRGFIETMLGGALEDRNNNRRFLNIIDSQAQRLGKLIDDILEISKMESEEPKLNIKPLDIQELIQEVMISFKPQLDKAKIKLSAQIKDTLPQVYADRDKIKQVLINLIDNAIKFNRENGSIKIGAETTDRVLKVNIADTGLGIPDKDISRIFERFYRVDKARSRELGGTGLGLAIVKHIIEAHHGKVGVESIEGQGSTFWFTLPSA